MLMFHRLDLPPHLGVLTQVSAVFGILFTQATGMHFARPSDWRYVTAISAAIAVLQVLASPFAINSPTWLSGSGLAVESQVASARLWGNNYTPLGHTESGAFTFLQTRLSLLSNITDAQRESPEDPLLSEERPTDVPVYTIKPKSVLQILRMPEMKRPLYIMSFAMLAQQFSGDSVSMAILTCPYQSPMLQGINAGQDALVKTGSSKSKQLYQFYIIVMTSFPKHYPLLRHMFRSASLS